MRLKAVVFAVLLMSLLPASLLPGTSFPSWGTGGSEHPGEDYSIREVSRPYGTGPVRLDGHQGADMAFRGRRGDRITLDVAPARKGDAHLQCWGPTSIVDARGRRSVDRLGVVRIRVSGRTVLRFRGRCGPRDLHAPVRLQLLKLRMHRLSVDGPPTRMPRASRGYLDVAWTKVPRTGRVKLVVDGRRADRHRREGSVLVGNEFARLRAEDSVAFEAGVVPWPDALDYGSGPTARAGTRVGWAVRPGLEVSALRTTVHRVTLDGPALVLEPEGGRERILVADVPPGTETLVTGDGWVGWQQPLPLHQQVGGEEGQVRYLVQTTQGRARADDQPVRVRGILQVPDLVVGGPPVHFASDDPGQPFVARIPAPTTDAHTVRLEVTGSTVAGGGWRLHVPPVLCIRDCFYPMLDMSSDGPGYVDGLLAIGVTHRAYVTFDDGASGGLWLRLTERPASQP